MLSRIANPTRVPFILVLLLLLAALRLTPTDLARPIYDFQVIFDISQSMAVEDVVVDKRSRGRLDLAKAAAQSLLKSLPCGSRLGWSAFTGRRSVTLLKPVEVCRHHAGLIASLEQIDGRMRWVEGSSVGKGVYQGLRAARAIGSATQVIFITDGHEAPPLRHGQSGIPRVDGLRVGGLLVGVGGDIPVPIPKTDKNGRVSGFWQAHQVVQLLDTTHQKSHEELSWLHRAHLLKLAQYSGLDYVELDSVKSLATAVKNADFSHPEVVPVDIRWVPALLALLLLCWRFSPIS